MMIGMGTPIAQSRMPRMFLSLLSLVLKEERAGGG